ncbi:hypothetical protein VD0002_g573 [Verticillium dahliae]|uniref:Uncharacterized protein n=1 Tax=Verticillium dahliae TaxID=27337 RepID=A0AA44WCH2_VERDA|nr:hypothetical protein BJF96_g7682 [Verticillium dahliae]PNH38094.1 hypothetical protein VD0004_g8711 [Verticillium dahliae]PNH56186.1 hypothetical protein VD0003_g1545 [Verticillium dahliae]PNH69942.1 hypothetical protein VD0002_g573 [Verticillium dahliae]PNH71985.1 hypothetical protein VD0001_g5568 [Verticillium dahliae]
MPGTAIFILHFQSLKALLTSNTSESTSRLCNHIQLVETALIQGGE